MAQSESGSNVAIIAIIVIAVLVAGAAFLYLQGRGAETEPTVIERDTTIINPPPVAEPPVPEGEGKATFEHEDEEGNKTEIQIQE